MCDFHENELLFGLPFGKKFGLDSKPSEPNEHPKRCKMMVPKVFTIIFLHTAFDFQMGGCYFVPANRLKNGSDEKKYNSRSMEGYRFEKVSSFSVVYSLKIRRKNVSNITVLACQQIS